MSIPLRPMELWEAEGAERIVESAAAWLHGIHRHQIREVRLEGCLIQGGEYIVTLIRHSDGAVRGLFVDEDGERFAFTTDPTSRAMREGSDG